MKSGVLVHPSELSKKWIDRIIENKIDVLGIHPVGGYRAAEYLKELTNITKTAKYRNLIDYAKDNGIEIEYEFHAGSFLLDRGLFKDHPEYFRMDETGNRTCDRNFCLSNEAGMNIVKENAISLYKDLYGTSEKLYFWLDDVRNKKCMCPKCKDYSSSEQQLVFLNTIIKELKKINPNVKMCYLAYLDWMEPPFKVKPEEGIFLEYAPIEKYKTDESRNEELIREEYENIKPLLSFFGEKDSKVLEYWLDNSMFSNWTKPPKEFKTNKQIILSDLNQYLALKFENIASFACFLGDDYEALYGNPDISPYSKALDEAN